MAVFQSGRQSLSQRPVRPARHRKRTSATLALDSDTTDRSVGVTLLQTPEDRGGAVVHIFRFDESRIVEFRGTGQAVPAEGVDKNGMLYSEN